MTRFNELVRYADQQIKELFRRVLKIEENLRDQHNVKLDRIIDLLNKSTIRDKEIMATLQDVQDLVTAEDTVIDSVVTLLEELTGQIKAIPTTDPATQAAIDALAADITAKTQTLSDAVVANTPVAHQQDAPPPVADPPADPAAGGGP